MTTTRADSASGIALGRSSRLTSAVARNATLVLVGVILTYALGVIVFGVIALAAQLAAGRISPTLYWNSDQFSFTSEGFEGSHVQIAGAGGGVVTNVTGASGGTVAVYVLATVVGMLTQAALAVLALRLVQRIRAGRPFAGAAWREVAALSAILLGLGVTTQLLNWWTRVAVLADAHGSTSFSTAFVFEPLTVTIGLALALVAVAFRYGERLQRDTSGLV